MPARKSKSPRKPREVIDRTDETKADKFRRLGQQRVTKAVKAITVIGNLSGAGYEYTETQIAAIKDALSFAVSNTLARFQPKQKKEAGLVIQL